MGWGDGVQRHPRSPAADPGPMPASVARPLVEITVPGHPKAKPRPRVARRGGVIEDAAQTAAEDAIGWALRAKHVRPLPGNIAVEVAFFASSRKVGDIDNLLKTVLDAANNIAWNDDAQVTKLSATLDLDKTNPRTVIRIWRHDSTLLRGDAAKPT